ncbi:hypothetical protein ANTQUA_LOCUS9803 [Anthophora quadrimaculata]
MWELYDVCHFVPAAWLLVRIIIRLKDNLTRVKITPSVTLKRHSQALVASVPLLAGFTRHVGCRNSTGNAIPFI